MNRFQAQSRKEKNTNILNSFKLYDRNIELINKIKNLLVEHSFSSSTIHVANPTTFRGIGYETDYSTIIVTINKLAYENDFVELFVITITADDIICDNLFETIKQKMDKEIFNIHSPVDKRPSPTPLPSNCK